MPPIAVSPLTAVVALGAMIVARWAVREFRRVNAELDALRMAREPVDRSHLPTLRRDPKSGVYRPQ